MMRVVVCHVQLAGLLLLDGYHYGLALSAASVVDHQVDAAAQIDEFGVQMRLCTRSPELLLAGGG